MATATVRAHGWYKGSDGRNAGQLYVGDTLLGSKTGVFNFYQIRRKENGNVINFNGKCALSLVNVADDPMPELEEPPDSQRRRV